MDIRLLIARLSYNSSKRSIKSKNPKTRLSTAVGLGHLHEVARLPTPLIEELLIPALQDEDNRVRAQAALSLYWNGYSKMAIPFLQAALKDEDGKVRKSAVYALVSTGRFMKPLSRLNMKPVVSAFCTDQVSRNGFIIHADWTGCRTSVNYEAIRAIVLKKQKKI